MRLVILVWASSVPESTGQSAESPQEATESVASQVGAFLGPLLLCKMYYV